LATFHSSFNNLASSCQAIIRGIILDFGVILAGRPIPAASLRTPSELDGLDNEGVEVAALRFCLTFNPGGQVFRDG